MTVARAGLIAANDGTRNASPPSTNPPPCRTKRISGVASNAMLSSSTTTAYRAVSSRMGAPNVTDVRGDTR